MQPPKTTQGKQVNLFVCVLKVCDVVAMVKSACVVLEMNSHNCYPLVSVYLQTEQHSVKYLFGNIQMCTPVKYESTSFFLLSNFSFKANYFMKRHSYFYLLPAFPNKLILSQFKN